MPPMETDGEALTADDIEIFSAFADDALKLCGLMRR